MLAPRPAGRAGQSFPIAQPGQSRLVLPRLAGAVLHMHPLSAIVGIVGLVGMVSFLPYFDP